MKTTVCDICHHITPEVKVKAKETLIKKVRHLWLEHEKLVTDYDICLTCWAKILNHIKPLDKNGRRKRG